MARANVYVPDELKKRMDAVTEPVNWSQVAAAAFEAKLASIASRKVVEDMDEVIERLRASKKECESEDREDGLKSGRDWAKSHASWRELDRLTTVANESDFWTEGSEPIDWGRQVLEAMDPDAENWNHREVRDFWKLWSDESPTFEWLGAFCDGATEVFNDVQAKL